MNLQILLTTCILFGLSQMGYGNMEGLGTHLPSFAYTQDVAYLGSNLSAIAYAYCPINTFCKSGMDQPHLGVNNSCCEPCSCDVDCYIGQQCCPDSGIDQSKRYDDLSLSCRPMDELFNAYRTVSDDFKYSEPGKGYYVIDDCPADFPDYDVLEGCLAPRTIREHVFVTDPRSMLIYKNYQCAICNDILDYETWDLRLICTYSDSLYSVQKDDNAILDHCYVYPQPAPLSPSRKWACNTMYIDTCNVTGHWDVQDDVIAEACATYNALYFDGTYGDYDSVLSSIEMYKNVYCYLCNTKTGQGRVNMKCVLPQPPWGTPILSGVPFEGRLDLTAYESAHAYKEPDNKCSVNEMADPFTGGCIALLCPFGQTPFFGNCTSYIDQTKISISAIIGFKITAFNGTPWPKDEIPSYEMAIALSSTIQRLFSTTNCIYCQIDISLDAFLVQAVSGNECGIDMILKLFDNLARLSHIKSDNGMEEYELETWITTRYSVLKEPNRIHFRSWTSLLWDFVGMCTWAVQLSPKSLCKRVRFSPLDLAINGMPKGTIERILAKAEVDVHCNDKTVLYVICIDDYMSIAMTNKGVREQTFQITLLVMSVGVFLSKVMVLYQCTF